jgi:DNA polymerase-3 subunit delta'
MTKGKTNNGVVLEPQRHFFSTIFGHEFLKQLLLKIEAERRVPNAVLFHGPPDVGKKSLAYGYIKVLNCKRGLAKGGRCDCRSCEKIARGVHPDVVISSLAPRSKQIVMDEARRIQELATLPPLEGRIRVVLIADADLLNPSAANSLLKILEEPPQHTLFLLVTTRPYAVLPTIRSRCVQLRVAPAPRAELAQWLSSTLNLTPEKAHVAVLLAEGRTGGALRYLLGAAAQSRLASLQELTTFARDGFAALFRTVTKLLRADQSVEEMMSLVLSWYRDLLVCRASHGNIDLVVNQDAAKQIAAMAPHYPVTGLLRAIARMVEYQKLTRRTVHERLMLEVLLSQIGMELRRSV